MAAETAIAVGDLAAARKLAEDIRDMPFYREEGHLAATALAGNSGRDGAFARGSESWERAGGWLLGAVRGRGGVRAARADAGRPGGVAHGGDALITPGLPVEDPPWRVLRRAGAAPPRLAAGGDRHAAGGVPCPTTPMATVVRLAPRARPRWPAYPAAADRIRRGGGTWRQSDRAGHRGAFGRAPVDRDGALAAAERLSAARAAGGHARLSSRTARSERTARPSLAAMGATRMAAG